MHAKWQVYIGILVTLIGLMFLIGAIFDVDVGAFCWPIGLIALGIWLLLRPQLVGPDMAARLKLLGDIRRRGEWPVADEEMWVGIGDVNLDLTSADIPVGETTLRILGFVGDVKVRVPQGVGVSVSSTSFVTDARIFGEKRDGIFFPVHFASQDYDTAERKIRLETAHFVMSLRVRQEVEQARP
jgi:lia operon protein LiaF